MKLNELMKGVTPDPAYEGWVTNDDFVFAIDLTPGAEQATEVKNFAVVQMGIEGLDAQLNPITVDKTYIRAGKSTQRTGTQRTFKMSVTAISVMRRRITSFLMRSSTGQAMQLLPTTLILIS